MRQLRDYQIDVKRAVRAGFVSGLKGVVIEIPTGTGKGMIIANISKDVIEKKGRVLIAVNRDNLCNQLFESCREQGLYPTMERGTDHASPLSDLVVASIQSSRGARLQKWNPKHFSLVITDEVHGAAAKSFRETLGHFQFTYHLGVTATLARHDKKGLWGGFQKCVYSMTLTEAVNLGWLVGFEFEELPVPIVIDDKTAAKNQFTQKDEDSVFEKDNYLPRLFSEAARRSTQDKSLFFWPNCKSSEEAAIAFQACGIESKHVDGYQSDKAIAETLDWFKAPGIKALHNADLLSYGYDNPSITLIGIMRLSRSIPMLKQRLGRGTRPLCRVDDYPTAEERRAAIVASGKPRCKVLDLMIQLGEVQNKFATPTCLITEDDEERKFLEQERRNGIPVKLEELETKLKTKRETDRDKALAKLAEDAANAAERSRHKQGKASEPYIDDIIYGKTFGAEASQKQVNYIRHLMNGRTPALALTSHQASKIIGRCLKHKERMAKFV